MRLLEIAKRYRRREEEADEISKRTFFETFSRHFRREVPLLREAGIALEVDRGFEQWCVVMSHPRYEPKVCLQVSDTGAFSYWLRGYTDARYGVASCEGDRERFVTYLVERIHLTEEGA